MAYIYAHQKRYREAENLYKKVIGIRENILGKNHLDTANAYNNLAELYLLQHKYVKAKELYEEYIRILKKVLEKDNYYMVVGYSNLEVVYVMQKEYKNALIYLLKAYKIAVSDRLLQSAGQRRRPHGGAPFYAGAAAGNWPQGRESGLCDPSCGSGDLPAGEGGGD